MRKILFVLFLALSIPVYARWDDGGVSGTMTYPDEGIALSTGSAWDTSITDNSANWDTAYGWGDHSTEGYLKDNQNITFTGNLGIGTTSVFTVDANTIDFSDVTEDYVLTFNASTNTWAGEAASSGTIDGSGTGAQVALWSDSNTLTDSIIYDNGSNVGIGTTNPDAVLTVNGGAHIGGTGNCGIGTDTPAYLLEVNGTLQADDYYSGDGTQGVTCTVCAGFKDGLCISSGD